MTPTDDDRVGQSDDARLDPRQRRLRTSWLVTAFVVIVLAVATVLIVAQFDGEDDVPEETDVGAPAFRVIEQ